jgi:hypothetical protein
MWAADQDGTMKVHGDIEMTEFDACGEYRKNQDLARGFTLKYTPRRTRGGF